MGAIGFALLGLIFLKVVIVLLGALLYAIGPLMIALVPTDGGIVIARAWVSAALALLMLPLAWSTILAVGALLINDSSTAGPLIAGQGSIASLLGGLLLAFAGLASLWLCIRAAREAGAVLRGQLGGLLVLGRARGGATASAAPASTRRAAESLRSFAGRVAGATGAALGAAGPPGQAVASGARAFAAHSRHGLLGAGGAVIRTGALAAAPGTAALVGRTPRRSNRRANGSRRHRKLADLEDPDRTRATIGRPVPILIARRARGGARAKWTGTDAPASRCRPNRPAERQLEGTSGLCRAASRASPTAKRRRSCASQRPNRQDPPADQIDEARHPAAARSREQSAADSQAGKPARIAAAAAAEGNLMQTLRRLNDPERYYGLSWRGWLGVAVGGGLLYGAVRISPLGLRPTITIVVLALTFCGVVLHALSGQALGPGRHLLALIRYGLTPKQLTLPGRARTRRADPRRRSPDRRGRRLPGRACSRGGGAMRKARTGSLGRLLPIDVVEPDGLIVTSDGRYVRLIECERMPNAITADDGAQARIERAIRRDLPWDPRPASTRDLRADRPDSRRGGARRGPSPGQTSRATTTAATDATTWPRPDAGCCRRRPSRSSTPPAQNNPRSPPAGGWPSPTNPKEKTSGSASATRWLPAELAPRGALTSARPPTACDRPSRFKPSSPRSGSSRGRSTACKRWHACGSASTPPPASCPTWTRSPRRPDWRAQPPPRKPAAGATGFSTPSARGPSPRESTRPILAGCVTPTGRSRRSCTSERRRSTPRCGG